MLNRYTLSAALALILLVVAAPPIDTGNEVVYCSNTQSCYQKVIETSPENCNEWYPSFPRDELECDRTPEGSGDVTLVTDPANYVTAEFSDESYSVRTFPIPTDEPWDLEFLPDGTLMFTGQWGDIYLRRDGEIESVGEVETMATRQVGLMGLAAHPDFESNGYIYLYYTEPPRGKREVKGWAAPVTNKLVRYRFKNGTIGNGTLLLTVPGDTIHSGGRIEFGPDGKLYVATGDAHTRLNPMREEQLVGKILRLNPDGSVPGDNPIDGNYLYSFGHRNPQGMAWHPETGRLYNSEHGPWRYDEINRVERGENHGWGAYRCSDTTTWINVTTNFTGPATCFEEWTLGPSGMVFVDEPGHPWYGDLFVAGLRGNHLHRFHPDDGEMGEGSIFWMKRNLSHGWDNRRIRDVEFHDGKLWLLGDTSGMAVIEPEP